MIPFFQLTIQGTPVAKGRPRVAQSGHVYTPEKTRNYEQQIRQMTAITMAGRSATKSAVIVHVAAIFEPPPSATRSRRALLLEGSIHPIKPDLDNVVKAALDGICFENGAIRDDKQIVELCAFKMYGQNACLMLDVFEVESTVDRFSNRWRAWESGDVAVSPI
jgi:Holliday junction resolvase RusA-like endonuclease